jgi:eukaryotic-like serine/threonine-protein kinase
MPTRLLCENRSEGICTKNCRAGNGSPKTILTSVVCCLRSLVGWCHHKIMEINKTLKRIVENLAEESLPDSPKTTIKPTNLAQTLPLSLRQPVMTREATSEFEVLSLLGEGGMGRVELAKQHVLEREVALKRVRVEQRSDRAEESLRREALYTGALEHPNIIPVHGLIRDEQGFVLVMKRVEGTVWRELLRETDSSLIGDQPPMLRHLEILMQVCTAVHFAHSRGILHRDIKPENIMLGAFGEVYLADWGLARRISEPDNLSSPIGTPAFLAPEMLTGETSVASDVYLLGACLYFILTGHAPHRGSTVREALLSAATVVPSFPESPKELSEICQHAMHTDPTKRFESAAALRDALAAFLRHRGSLGLTEEAQRRLLEAQRLPPEDTHQRRKLLVESRFGLQQALREWSQNKEATQHSQECIEALLDLELYEKNFSAAQLLLTELQEPSPQRHQQLQQLQKQRQEEEQAKARLAHLEHEKDLGVANRSKSLLLMLLVAFNFATIFGLRALRQSGAMILSPWSSLRISLLMLVVVLVLLWAGRDAFFKNQANRQFSLSLLVVSVSLVMHRAINLIVGRQVDPLYTDELFWLGAIFGLLSIFLLRWLALLALFAVSMSLASIRYPTYSSEMMGVVLGMPLWVLVFLWSRPDKKH